MMKSGRVGEVFVDVVEEESSQQRMVLPRKMALLWKW